MPPILEVRNLSKTYAHEQGDIKALDRVTLGVNERELVSIVGPSGCGKTTCLECIAGLLLPDAGDIYLQGRLVTGQSGHTGYMTQSDVMLPWRTVLDNMIIPLEIADTEQIVAREQGKQLFSEFGLEGFESRAPHELSGGMRQRAALARTYLTNRAILLLDEPFGRLDALTRSQMQAWFLKTWENERKTVLLVTHDVDEALLLSDRVYVFTARPGRVAEEIAVLIPRPRNLTVTTTPDFGALKQRTFHALNLLS